MLKRMLRFVLELPSMSWVRAGIFSLEACAERKRLKKTAEILGLSVFSLNDLRTFRELRPDATTAFILGTGGSVADLSEEKLAHIRSQFSIGVNQWILHPLVPDVYAYEVDPDVRLLRALDRREVRQRSPHLLFLKPSKPEDLSNAKSIPEFMRDKVHLYSRVNIWTRTEQNIAQDFRSITKSIARRGSPEVLLDNGASIARLLALAVLIGFERIVLVGVDLNSVEYFWQRRPDLAVVDHLRNLATAQKGLTHETMSDDGRPFSISSYIERISSLMNIQVESKTSYLANYLEVWNSDQA